jgi:GH25 family lysozyme M1 (1,4-beta-N-acetylmuramidase)
MLLPTSRPTPTLPKSPSADIWGGEKENKNMKEGIDIYEHNDIYWNIVKLDWVSIKTSEGFYADPKYVERMKAAQDLGIPRMPYHIIWTNLDHVRQENEYIEKFTKSGWEIPPAIDWELHCGVGWRTQVSRMKAMCARIHAEIGTYPPIYTGKWFIDDLYQYIIPGSQEYLDLQSDRDGLGYFKNYPLWLMDYSYKLIRTREQMLTAPPPVKIPYPWTDWTILQWTDHGSIMGSPGSADINVAKESIFVSSPPIPVAETWEESIDEWARGMAENPYTGRKP